MERNKMIKRNYRELEVGKCRLRSVKTWKLKKNYAVFNVAATHDPNGPTWWPPVTCNSVQLQVPHLIFY